MKTAQRAGITLWALPDPCGSVRSAKMSRRSGALCRLTSRRFATRAGSHAFPAKRDQPPPESSPVDTVSAAQRQLDYADGLFAQKQYDLAIPEFEKYLDLHPTGAGRANAFFFLGESYRALNKPGAARRNFQSVLDDFPESDFAGPAAYVLAESAFTEKNYGAALPLFHRAGAKSKEAPVVLSARYFEARCLESLDKKDDAVGLYQQVIDAKNPNPYREDSRSAAASILLARGKKADALRAIRGAFQRSAKGGAERRGLGSRRSHRNGSDPA